jgi:hypothetical protein
VRSNSVIFFERQRREFILAWGKRSAAPGAVHEHEQALKARLNRFEKNNNNPRFQRGFEFSAETLG